MQYWPRKRSLSDLPRIRQWAKTEEPKLLGFIGYKVGMKSVFLMQGKSKILSPVTVLECPPMKLLSVRAYKTNEFGNFLVKEVFVGASKTATKYMPKLSSKKFKEADLESLGSDLDSYSFLKAVIYTQPSLTGIGRKAPQVYEIGLGGKVAEQFEYAKSLVGKDIRVSDIFGKLPAFVDLHGITKGKGFQGPVKRFGVSIRFHKSEKTKRGPGSLGSWNSQGHIMYRVAHAGQTGYHMRTEYNHLLLSASSDISSINPASGWRHYGIVKNDYVLIKGSVQGPSKRSVIFTYPIRNNVFKGQLKLA